MGLFWLSRERVQEERGCISRTPVLFIVEVVVKGGDVEVPRNGDVVIVQYSQSK